MTVVKQLWIVLLALPLAVSAAQVYRWVDDQGKVHYGDQPPGSVEGNAEKKKFGGNVIEADKASYATRQAAEKFPVTLYITDCGEPCTSARNYLKKRGVPFTEKDANDPKVLEEIKKLINSPEVPVLVVGDRTLKGFLADSWDKALDAAGYPKSDPLASERK